MKSQFTEEVFPSELEEIIKRRRERNLVCPNADGPPDANKGLTGLALSGGGIRSATVSLGVIQGLVSKNQFHIIDYLSSVSGGGYIGSSISSTLNRPGASESSFTNVDGSVDTPTVKHLRNSCDYLIGGTAVDRMRVPMIILRGMLINLWLVIPALILAVFLTELLTEAWHLIGAPIVSPLIICAPFLGLALLYPTVIRVFAGSFNWKMRNFYEKGLAILFVLSIVGMLLVPLLWLVGYCIDNNWDGQINRYFSSTSATSGMIHVGSVIGITGALFTLSRMARTFPVLKRFVINTIFAIVGPVFIFTAYLFLCVFFVESPYFTDAIDETTKTEKITSYSEILNQLSDKNTENLNKNEHHQLNLLITKLRHNNVEIPYAKADEYYKISSENHRSKTAEKTWQLSMGTNFKVSIQSAGDYLFLPEKSLFNLHAEWGFYAAGLLFLILNFIFFDANVTSTHGFYRDRLSRTFLFRIKKDELSEESFLETNDDQKLSELNAHSHIAPYHLINTTLNLPKSNDPDLRGRKADFFTLSKRYCGSDHTGYCLTTDIEAADRNLNLGAAMAISAGAASPNMGTETKNYFVFIMTLLNIRLGYWIPNPAKILPASRLRKALWPNVGPRYLFREALGQLDNKCAHVNLSDGGHIENLAIYQLLKRRCKLIIAVDAEADPDATFGGLITLIRFANIDMGIRIDINLEDMQKDNAGLSQTHWKLATIHYGADESGTPETGHLLYLKSSMTGNENEYIKAYKRDNPSFPHQSTADQSFDETQFEVYRSLGEHIANTALNNHEVQKVMQTLC
ncbi:MAG: hypothetical protein ACI85N_001822 [Gammaproteobacteria bacterium]|jgi:hypothetical protein